MKPTHIFYCVLALLLFSVSCRKQRVPKVEMDLTPAEIHLPGDAQSTMQLSAKIKNTNTTANVRWTSANISVATVSQSGEVKGLTPGETDIIATAVDGVGTAKAKVIVYDTSDYKFRVVLKDKGPVQFSLNNPSAYLSARALARRNKMSITIDSSDIPISAQYLTQIQAAGGLIVAKSKWLKTVSVHCHDMATLDRIKALPFVKEATFVWTGKKDTVQFFKKTIAHSNATIPRSVTSSEYYGSAWDNINIHQGEALHNAGFKGSGVQIAVLDNGFTNITSNQGLNNINILGSKSFIYEVSDPYRSGNHGVSVTSCMAGNKPGTFVGTAPEASYWLFKTEDEESEYPIEEDYWVSALEYADSVGADVTNTSLGYKGYDAPARSIEFSDMDGATTQAAKGAAFAAKKGMIMVVSAGNDRSWVGTPADSPDVLTVGSITRSLSISTFSSFGMTPDNRIKPDVVALGSSTALIGVSGTPSYSSGTSFAGPVMCGLVACLWQAFPKLTNREIIVAIRQSSSSYAAPALPIGYGIPDMQKAMLIATTLSVGR